MQQVLAAQSAKQQQAGPQQAAPPASLSVQQYKNLTPMQQSQAFDSYIQNLKDRKIHATIQKGDIRAYISAEHPEQPPVSSKFKKDSLFKIAFTLGLEKNRTPENVITEIYRIVGI
jgi:hypothetical protein